MEQDLRGALKKILFLSDIKCICCGKELQQESRYCVCDNCLQTLPFINQKVCRKCGEPINSLAEYCMSCKNHVDRGFDKARAVFLYDDKLIELVTRFKFYGERYLGEYLSRFLLDKYLTQNFDSQLIVPTPISQKRAKSRGYNQSELLCDAFEKYGLSVDASCVAKIAETRDQVGLGYKDRQQNLKGAFKVVNKSAVKNKNILIVDDIFTTGSTVGEISEVLKKAGANRVDVLTLCHQMPKDKKN